MLVGDVRGAITSRRSSWMLSGTSQWSEGPTKSSKKRQVLRATLRNAARPARCTSARVRRCGRPVAYAIAGEMNQSARIGSASGRRDGATTAMPTAMSAAVIGAPAILRNRSAGDFSIRAARSDVTHSRRRRRVHSMRTSVRTIASSITEL